MCTGSVCTSPPMSPMSPLSPNFFLGRQLVSSMDSPQRSRASTLTGIVIDRDWSGRTFNIPDCPARHSVGSLKGWYIRNICPTAEANSLRILPPDANNPIDDDTPFWHLAAGEESFTVRVIHVPRPTGPKSPSVDNNNVRMITVYVQHESTGMCTAAQVPLNSTLLQLKISAFSQLALGDAQAALDPRIRFSLNNQLLDNECTLHASGLSNGDRVFLSERHTPPNSHRAPRTPSPTLETERYNSIAGIWANQEPVAASTPQEPCSTRRRRNSDSKARNRRHEGELERMKSSYRTKMCRSGAGHCKFGQSCWFAHSVEELRQPSDPLPANCPGVSKLEKYAKRQDSH